MITEKWQYDICIRDLLENECLVSSIANHLYPEIAMAADRERKLLEIPEMERLDAVLKENRKNLKREIDEWREKQQ